MRVRASVFRSLASLHRAGVPWPQALESAAGSATGLEDAQRALQTGTSLSEALAGVVDPLDRAVLRAGEETGGLEAALDRIAERHDSEARDDGARRTALLYPVVMAHVAAVLLPIPDFVAGQGASGLLWSAAVLVPVYGLLYLTRRRRVGARGGGDRHPGTRKPAARGLFKSAVEEADARALTALADCYEAGVPLNEGLPLVVAAGAGGRVAWDVYRGLPRVRDGDPVASAWDAVPEPYRSELTAGEHAGELGHAARHAATRLRFDVEMRRKKMASMLPLIVLLAVAAVIAVRVIGFYTNVYSGLAGR